MKRIFRSTDGSGDYVGEGKVHLFERLAANDILLRHIWLSNELSDGLCDMSDELLAIKFRCFHFKRIGRE